MLLLSLANLLNREAILPGTSSPTIFHALSLKNNRLFTLFALYVYSFEDGSCYNYIIKPTARVKEKNMKKLLLLLIAHTFIASSCQQTSPKDNPEQLKTVLLDFFEGIETKNFQKMKDLTTEELILFDDGQVFTRDILINIIKGLPNYKTAKYKLDNFKIDVDDNSGNIYYHNQYDAVINDTSNLQIKWLESATFKKMDGKWKINFLHSTLKK
jgi:hypothetical protein